MGNRGLGLLFAAALFLAGVVPAWTLVSAQDGAMLTDERLRNLAYPNDFTAGGTAPLTDGAYTEPIQPDADSQVMVSLERAAFGLIEGRPAAAVILITDPGGSGTFIDLHLVDDALTPVASTFLGDRVRPQALQIVDDYIVVDLLGFGPDDPACCPSHNVSQTYNLQDGRLRLVAGQSVPTFITVPEGTSLVGWYGEPTTAAAILASTPLLRLLWWFDPTTDRWLLDSRDLPPVLRPTIPISRGLGFFVVARDATSIPVPLITPPAPCPLNPAPVNPLDPSLIVQTPGNGATLASPFTVTGLARVFEASVSLRLLDADGAILADTFTTAAEGAPTLAPFSGTVTFDVPIETAACLQVFEASARDGAPVNVVQISLTLLPATTGP